MAAEVIVASGGHAEIITLVQLVDASSVFISHLSKIERWMVSAPLSKITRIAKAPGVPEEWFFNHRSGSGPLERAYVVRQANRRNLNLLYGEPVDQAGFVDQLLSGSIGGQFHQGISDYSLPSEKVLDQVFSRAGELHGIVLEGAMELTIQQEIIVLKAGDSFSFAGKIIHLLRNTSDQPARLKGPIQP